jgi:diguanylate cyclase (GGDEF)-like protein/PAS domain S-box-containing protein
MKTKDEVNACTAEVQRLQEEVERLNKIVRVLMDRSERMTSKAESEYGLFQRRLVLGEFVRQRTEELHGALNQNETITRRLRVSEARFRALAEQSLVGIAVVEASGFIYLNAQFAEIFGYTQSELTALRLMSTVSDESIEVFTDHLHKCQTGQPHEALLSYQGRKKDGTVVDLELSSSRMTAGDDDEALILVVRDVTARKQAERKVQILNERLAELAVRDPLTGLYNRRFMEASLEREFIGAARSGSTLSVVLCDIDHFKAVNDTYGHQAGDEVLQAFGALLRQHCRKSDIACRYGGEEFLVVFPGMPVGLAADWAERVRGAIEAAQIEAGADTLRITASFGVASFPAHAQTWQEVIGAADSALYSTKTGGRNQVRRAPFLVTVSGDSTQRSRVTKSQPRTAEQALNGTRM